ncbi:flagellar export protein FliJ [Thalassolituus sp. LLYu03]|uniref:flagellar export protein FliJ n=1 Tax=Thalassolituus sp. LLYu03 TaxID=3421656 RepID=UPI003D293F7D
MNRRHPRARRLQVVLDLTEREEKEALSVWGDIEQKLRAEEQQREQLSLYRDEYQQKISLPGQLSAGHMHNTLGFMSQIESAMRSQNEQISLLRKRADAARELYLQWHGKVKALSDLIDRLEGEAAAADDRQAQKQSDEWANRAAFNRNGQRRT